MKRLPSLLALLALCGVAAAAAAAESTTHGRFEQIAVYLPSGTPTQFVMLLSDRAGWDASMAGIAQSLADQGALVAGLRTPALLARLEGENDACAFPDGDFENLSHYLQAYYQVPTYLSPILAGVGTGAALAYALAAQSPKSTFGGLLTEGFCPQLPLRKPLCKGAGSHFRPSAPTAGAAPARDTATPSLTLLPSGRLAIPWRALSRAGQACSPVTARRFVDQVAPGQWVEGAEAALPAAYASLAAHAGSSLPPAPASLADLPVIEMPAAGDGTRFAVLLSGDGGWAGIDKRVAEALVARGIPVAGFDSLRYFWTPRTPEGLAADLERMIAFYAHRWQRSELLLIGYSQGADVLPFAVNRLAPEARRAIRLLALLSLGQNAAFEFHVGNWIGPSGDMPILPEAQRLDPAQTLCVYGREEDDSLCPALQPAHAQVQALKGGHHYDGDYATLTTLILQHADRR